MKISIFESLSSVNQKVFVFCKSVGGLFLSVLEQNNIDLTLIKV